jgi:sulfur relay (sulfurtransferase) DsrF/TusC family protein
MDLVNVIRKVQRKKAARKRSEKQAFCFICEKQVSLLTFQQASELNETNRLKITKHLEKGLLHRIHNSKGEVSICRDSLQKAELQEAETLPLRPNFLKTLEMV